ncbi:antibiotic biosynthesis monooxygenase [Cohnella sp. CFH 77786]|uniref:antibiotic biosynthesis monooxygenase family protein n=1 Tax=Cohnella sp. CFH 77786 TaxID=2662265 RepID=UPI001C60950C|nr:antibiotic biosynthesis monooxygenase [Cohnella sp. CFH 77786]MBW5446224.1 antibiotic biosynthesis monooxygenase [Cohnella sp. CFH 77786]
MITEVAILNVKPGLMNEFESQFRKASIILSAARGHRSHELHKCVEEADKYILLVQWDTLTDHRVGFRRSEAFEEWKNLLAPFFDSIPTAEHYVKIKL